MADKKARSRNENPAFAFFLHPSSFASVSPAPVSLRHFKEQARERRTDATLPRFSGNATFIFYLNFRESFTTDSEDFTDGRRCTLDDGICKRLIGRGFRQTIKEKTGRRQGNPTVQQEKTEETEPCPWEENRGWTRMDADF
jgi:hypothetical protein